MNQDDWLLLCRTVRFGDTDAAGVMHFARLLTWCHEAYEESLERFGLEASLTFPTPGMTPEVALPIVHCNADFKAPLACGDSLTIRIHPRRLDPGCFEVHYRYSTAEQVVAIGLTRHLAIHAGNRRRCALPEHINRWLEASALGCGIQPL